MENTQTRTAVYLITVKSGKCYVGISWDPEFTRLKRHYTAKSYIGSAIRKHGIKAFEILSWWRTAKEAGNEEKIQIIKHKTKMPHGYNMTDCGEGTVGYEFTKEDIEKNSKAVKKYFEDPAARERNGIAQKKRWSCPGVKEEWSNIVKKQYEDPAVRKRLGKAQKKGWEDPAARERSSIAQKKRSRTPEARERQRQITKNYWANTAPEQKAIAADKMREGAVRARAKKKVAKEAAAA